MSWSVNRPGFPLAKNDEGAYLSPELRLSMDRNLHLLSHHDAPSHLL